MTAGQHTAKFMVVCFRFLSPILLLYCTLLLWKCNTKNHWKSLVVTRIVNSLLLAICFSNKSRLNAAFPWTKTLFLNGCFQIPTWLLGCSPALSEVRRVQRASTCSLENQIPTSHSEELCYVNAWASRVGFNSWKNGRKMVLSQKFKIAPEKLAFPKQGSRNSLPTIIFQGRAVKLQGCIWFSQLPCHWFIMTPY